MNATLRDTFEKAANASNGTLPEAVKTMKANAFRQFESRGFPTVEQEDWRFTNTAPIAELPFSLSKTGDIPDHLQTGNIQISSPIRLVFINGKYCARLSRTGDLPCGVVVGSLAEGLCQKPELVLYCLLKEISIPFNSFFDLNTAFFADGTFIWIPDGTELTHPVHVLHITHPDSRGNFCHPRNIYRVGKNAKLQVIEEYVSSSDLEVFNNPVTQIFVEHGGQCDHIKLQTESAQTFHVSTIYIEQGSASNVASHSISLGGMLARNDIIGVFQGEGGYHLLNGLYLAHDKQLVDHHTSIHHKKPHCESHEFYHGILNDQAKGVFNGKIFVSKGAQKTDAKQTNRNLLLSSDATIDTKPQLEIFADDVKCTHGATVGQLNEDAIFYLQARGIGEAMARQILIHAFAKEIVDRLQPVSLQDQINLLIQKYLTNS